MTPLKKYLNENKDILKSIREHTPKKIWEDMPWDGGIYTSEQLKAVEITVKYFHKHLGGLYAK